MSVALFLETKNEFTEHLIDTLTPFIYEGLNSIYKSANKSAIESNSQDKVLLIFQKYLQSVESWNQMQIDEETTRIKQLSNTTEYFDKLVKAVVKSNIILLTNSNSISNIIGQTFYNSLTTSTFIHRCYTECAKDAHNNPYLFYHEVEPMDVKRNQMIIQQNIQLGITRAIRKILPISMILEEYLINSMNIIQEPAKVELVGMSKAPTVTKPVSEKKIDPKLEKDVMNIIKSENIKTDKEKIKAIMNINDLITNMEPKMVEISDKQKKIPSVKGAPIDFGTDTETDDPLNDGLNKSDKKIMNIDFDNGTTVDKTSKKSISVTTISDNGVGKITKVSKTGMETSERVDPNKVNLIEDYGQMGGRQKRKKH